MASTKTSQSHPLVINAVVVQQGGGTIGLTFCPGKKQMGALSGDWNRDLSIDLLAIREFGASALVTLMEGWELEHYGVPVQALSEQAKALGIEWLHLPVVDQGIPDRTFDECWDVAGLRLHEILAGGGKIVVHCRGGLGRTGTVAGRLLVEIGEGSESAIARIRSARKGSIENLAQENYVRSCEAMRPERRFEDE
jgi:ADP-ribosyl-[dinitrogen reductase] hydrolase